MIIFTINKIFVMQFLIVNITGSTMYYTFCFAALEEDFDIWNQQFILSAIQDVYFIKKCHIFEPLF